MPIIVLKTAIHAPIAICFDLSRSIDLHQISTAASNERAIAGVTKGLIGLNEWVTWEATHFGVKQRLTSRITRFDRPYYFQDIQVKGAFRSFIHDHLFQTEGTHVVMTDRFEFTSPFGVLGHIFNKLILTRYMTHLLKDRNAVVKEYAESDKWKTVLPPFE